MSAFDHLADQYDEEFSDRGVGREQRLIVHTYLAQWSDQQGVSKVLELNGGTGRDAAFLKAIGHEVTMTDLSPDMVRVAGETIDLVETGGKAKAMVLDIRTINPAQLDGPYDLIFSNFGGLNCISPKELDRFLSVLPELLTEQGHFMAVVMPRFCWWETAYFLMKGSGRKAFRRSSRQPVAVDLEGVNLNIWYYNPSDFEMKLPGFQRMTRKPVGFFLPPSYLEPRFRNRPKSLSRLARWEKRSSKMASLSTWSDHFLLHLQKRS